MVGSKHPLGSVDKTLNVLTSLRRVVNTFSGDVAILTSKKSLSAET